MRVISIFVIISTFMIIATLVLSIGQKRPTWASITVNSFLDIHRQRQALLLCSNENYNVVSTK